MKATVELKMLPVSVLKPAAYNPRKKLKPGDGRASALPILHEILEDYDYGSYEEN